MIFISPKQASEILGCSKRHVYNLIYQKKLKVFKEGIIRIYKSSFDDYLANHTEGDKNEKDSKRKVTFDDIPVIQEKK